VANGRKRRQTIFSLQNGERHITGDGNLIKHATKFYKKLFGLGEGNAFDIDESMWPLRVKMMAFGEEEIKRALDFMEKNKVVGPDGFPIEFF
jgi:4-hydroxyphenylpyruvate dioxygenase-like putative hemolysin